MAMIIRVDADPVVGMGHLMRCLAITEWVKSAGVRTRFAVHAPAADVRALIEVRYGHELYDVASSRASDADAREVGALADCRSDIILLDGYQFSDDYEHSLCEAGLPLAVLDDYGHAVHDAAKMLINGNLFYGRASLYHGTSAATKRLLGPTYTLVRREFTLYRRPQPWQGSMTTVLVSLGGGDHRKSLLPVLDALTERPGPPMDILVATGLAQLHRNGTGQQLRQRYPSVRWVEASGLPAVMATTDLAISAGGMTSYELAYMGVPAILLPATPIEAPVSEELAARGVAINLGLDNQFPHRAFENAFRMLESSPDRRREMSQLGQALFDGQGARRVAEALLGVSLASVAR